RELLYGGPVLVGHLGVDAFPALEDAVADLRPARVDVERLGQELADDGDAAAHRLVPLRRDLAGLHVARARDRVQVRVHEHGAVAEHAAARDELRVAGDLAAVGDDVVTAAYLCGHAHRPEHLDHRSGELLVAVETPGLVLREEAEVEVALVVVDGAAAG